MHCSNCEYMKQNKSSIDIKGKDCIMKSGKRYCTYGKTKEITRKALGNYSYPVWCPLNTYKGTCLYCGTMVREEEGEVCLNCKRKGL